MKKIKPLQAFGNAVTGESYQANTLHDVSDAYADEVVAAGLAVEIVERSADSPTIKARRPQAQKREAKR